MAGIATDVQGGFEYGRQEPVTGVRERVSCCSDPSWNHRTKLSEPFLKHAKNQ